MKVQNYFAVPLWGSHGGKAVYPLGTAGVGFSHWPCDFLVCIISMYIENVSKVVLVV